MDQQQFFLLGASVAMLFGGLQYFTPKVPWKDLTWFFRKDRRKYNRFSTSFFGKFYFCFGCFWLVLFGVSWLVPLPQKLWPYVVFFISGLITARVVAELKWRRDP